MPHEDTSLQTNLQDVVGRLGVEPLASTQKLSISLLDLSDPCEERYAGVNDRHMMYAASIPKIGVLLGAFQAMRDGILPRTPALEAALTRMIRESNNRDASRLIQRLGYDFIARTLANPSYRLYDSEFDGGLWVGKSFGPSGLRRHVEFWRPEAISGEWHAANTLQVTRFFWMLSRGELISPPASVSMKRILGKPGTSEYFVEGLHAAGVFNLYRKAGTYLDMHGDAVLVEHQGKRYVAVAMVNDPCGPTLLPRLIQELHGLVRPDAA